MSSLERVYINDISDWIRVGCPEMQEYPDKRLEGAFADHFRIATMFVSLVSECKVLGKFG